MSSESTTCRNGHPANASEAFCPTCGAALEGTYPSSASHAAGAGAPPPPWLASEPTRPADTRVPQPDAGAPGWGYQGTAVSRSTNGLAIASLILGILWLWGLGAILALIFGLMARKQIGVSNGRQGGGGLAVAGIVLGAVGIVGALILTLGLAAIGGSSSG